MRENEFNWRVTIRRWAKKAVRGLDYYDRKTLLYHAEPLIKEGKLRGDISEFWVSRWPHLKDKLTDLYL